MSKIKYDVIKESYGFALSIDGEVSGLVAGDHGYMGTGIFLDDNPYTDHKAEVDRCMLRIEELNQVITGDRPDLFHDSLVPGSRVSKVMELKAEVDRLRSALKDIEVQIIGSIEPLDQLVVLELAQQALKGNGCQYQDITVEDEVDRLREALIKQVGDTRECPHCRKTFIPQDTTQEEGLEALRIK